MIKRAHVATAAEELSGADLGDRRRTERLQVIAGLLEAGPASSFPRSMGSDAALEAFYRFINNDGFGAADIVEPHITSTLQRAASARNIVAVHDTTYVEYGAAREDLGPTTGKHHFGFVAHAALLLAEDDGAPLGVAHVETFRRTGTKWQKRKREGQRTRAHTQDKTRESLRWLRSFEAVESASEGHFGVIHVTDAEGDFFELLAASRAARYVIRAGQLDRVVSSDGETCSLREVADKILPSSWRQIDLSERKHPRRTNISTRRRHPNRSAHSAQLAIGAARITLGKTRYSEVDANPLDLTVVRVWEPWPPRAQPAVEWILLTTEDVSTPAALERIVDIYRKRWVIEEYFKALKSGCSLEKRQVESYDALCKVLALFVPIAYRLLLLRALERTDSRAPATKAFLPVDLQLMANAPSNRALAPPKTVADALAHLARLGGHIRNNGKPGWQTLAWGYEKLLLMKLGWEIAMKTGEK